MTGIEQVSTANYIDIEYVCRAITSSEIVELDGKKFLAIYDVYEGQINIVYQGQEIFLAVGQDKSILKI
ncbi:hypothetical protein [Nostoc sp. UHCC 0302]|uniref:hypothetical protein n=1 Tax=Nostoc sp. UHCC 0302 TaxID=3134896 RepID=UPI00311CE120